MKKILQIVLSFTSETIENLWLSNKKTTSASGILLITFVQLLHISYSFFTSFIKQ